MRFVHITNLIYDNAVRVATAQICCLLVQNVACVTDWTNENIVCYVCALKWNEGKYVFHLNAMRAHWFLDEIANGMEALRIWVSESLFEWTGWSNFVCSHIVLFNIKRLWTREKKTIKLLAFELDVLFYFPLCSRLQPFSFIEPKFIETYFTLIASMFDSVFMILHQFSFGTRCSTIIPR